MNKEELLQYLKDNLAIKIDTKPQHNYYSVVVGYEINVKLLLEYEEISFSIDSIDIK